MTSTEKSEKIVSPHKSLPFNTQSEKYAYSDFAHLEGNQRKFAIDLATTESGVVQPQTVAREPKRIQKVAIKAGDLKELLGGTTEEGVEPCARKECVAVVRKIIEVQTRNKQERNDILATCDMVMNEIQTADQDNVMLEEELVVANGETKRLEVTLNHLKDQMTKLQKTCRDLQHERDEFSNKVMVIETDRQRWVRRLQLADAALADVTWRGRSIEGSSQNGEMDGQSLLVGSLVITHGEDTEIQSASSVGRTAYADLVNEKMLDATEKPAPKPSVSTFIQDQLSRSSMRTSASLSSVNGRPLANEDGNRASGKFSLLNNMSKTSLERWFKKNKVKQAQGPEYNPYLMLPKIISSSISLPEAPNPNLTNTNFNYSGTASSPKKHRMHALTNECDGSLLLSLPTNSYKGYTPTGSPAFQSRPRTYQQQDQSLDMDPSGLDAGQSEVLEDGLAGGSSVVSAMTANTGNGTLPNSRASDRGGSVRSAPVKSKTYLTPLDPVFYRERARSSWKRSKKLGEIRVRYDFTKDTEAPPEEDAVDDGAFQKKPVADRKKCTRVRMLTSTGQPGIFNYDNA